MIKPINFVQRPILQLTKEGGMFPTKYTDKIIGARNGIVCTEDVRGVRKFYPYDELGRVGKLIKKKWINIKHFVQGEMSKSVAVNEYKRYPDGINITKQTTRYYDAENNLVSKTVYKQLQNDPRHIQNTRWDYENGLYTRKTKKPSLQNPNRVLTFVDNGWINPDGSVRLYSKHIKEYC